MAMQQDKTVAMWQTTKMMANMLTGVFGTSGRPEMEAAVKSFREINAAIVKMKENPLQITTKDLDALTDKVQALKKTAPWSMDLDLSSTELNLKSLKEMGDLDERMPAQGEESEPGQLDRAEHSTNGSLEQGVPGDGDQGRGVEGKGFPDRCRRGRDVDAVVHFPDRHGDRQDESVGGECRQRVLAGRWRR